MVINYDFIKHWTELGDEREGYYLDQFFYYFVAFNCLYENVFVSSFPNPADRKDKHERDKIYAFRKSLIYEHCKQNGFNPCEDLSKIPQLARGVEEAEGSPFNSRNKILDNENVELKEGKLFKNIYQVRCNLFHGQKYIKIQESRDFDLIKECVGVLKSLLDAYLKH